jgi:NTP pyrophosphatase (non-canonical NTP hydrolase)
MTLNEYAEAAMLTAVYPEEPSVEGFSIYPALGLVGEAGEFAEKVKKGIRDGNFDKAGAIKELGDVLWYVAACAHALHTPLEVVAGVNIAKLHSRMSRSAISGSGDER